MGPKYSRPNSSKRMEGQSMLLAASSARRARVTAVLPPIFAHDALGRLVQVLIVLVGDDAVEVAGDGAHIAVDGHSLSLRTMMSRLVCSPMLLRASNEIPLVNAASAGYGDYMLRASSKVASHGHTQELRRARCRHDRHRRSRAHSRCGA